MLCLSSLELYSRWVPLIAVLLIKILNFFRPLISVHLFQSNQRFQAIEFVDRNVSEKL